jgi:hypothetical protein
VANGVSVKASLLNGLKASTSGEVWCLEPMKTFSVRLPQIYRPTVEETIELLQAAPRIALLCIGATELLAGGFLMLLLVALLR